MLLLDRLQHHAATRPNAIAFLEAGSGRSLSWRALADAVQQMRPALPSRGVVLLSVANTADYPIAFLAILAAGCEVFPMSVDSTDAEAKRAKEQSGAVAMVGASMTVKHFTPGHSEAPPRMLSGEPITSNQPAQAASSLLLQSSGTTGLPKIVRRSARSLDAVSEAMAAAIGFTETDHVLAAVPLTHSYGLEHGLLAPVWAGSCVHLCRGLDLPSVIAELAREQITLFPAVPAMFEMLAGVSDAPRAAGLRTVYSAGAPLPASVIDRFCARFGVTIAQLYGATEIGSVTFNSPHEAPFDPTSVGRPMTGVSVRILDVTTTTPLGVGEEGHVAIRAAGMFEGYLHHPPELIDGYFPTGDLGKLDERGRLFITGRLKLLIDVGGMKVNPLEVEAVLQQHPQVALAVVVPIRQSETVNRLKAIVTSKTGKAIPVEDLRAFVKSRLSGFKVPRVFELRSSLPISATGKVQRHLVE